jgi:hypothetical protein
MCFGSFCSAFISLVLIFLKPCNRLFEFDQNLALLD